tara:strand:- start:7044 stop:8615 length:1572 start_codon:yes stop_codon:yes gene_type:complete
MAEKNKSIVTDKDKAAELYKCSKDPVYFISTYIKVVHPIFGLVPFELYPFQETLINEFKANRFNILRKFRQAGCTTLVAAYSLWKCIFTSHYKVVILSKDDDASMEVLTRMKTAYDELPDFLKRGLVKDNSHSLKFLNGSEIKSKSSSKQSGRSVAGSLLILDEAAFIENIDTIWAAAFPIVSTGGSVIALSTVNGVGNWFHNQYTLAKRGESSFHAIDINWKDHPQYKRHEGYEHLYEKLSRQNPPINIDDWEKTTRGGISYKEWLQEYEAEFLGTGDTFVDGEILKQLKEQVNNDYGTRYNNRLRLWHGPHPAHDYVIGCDTSLGRGLDSSVAQVIDLYTGEQVAEFKSNKTPINDFAKIIGEIGREYNNAYVVPERNLIGHNFIYQLREIEQYDNIFLDDKHELGIQLADANRRQMLVQMDEAIRLNKIKLNSERTVDELLTFIIDETGKYIADVNCHDDLIMSLSFAVFGFNEIRANTPMIRHRANEDNPSLPISQHKYYVRTAGGRYIEEEDYKWLIS